MCVMAVSRRDWCSVGCYGVSEMESVDSGSSSASTEPWFCDACRAGVKPVSCSQHSMHYQRCEMLLFVSDELAVVVHVDI